MGSRKVAKPISEREARPVQLSPHSAASTRKRLAHRLSQFVPAALAQGVDRPFAVAQFAVLAQFGLAFQARDGDFDADDGLEHGVDVVGRGVAHLPRSGLLRFMCARQACDHTAHKPFVVAHGDVAVGMHDFIIPRRHLKVGGVLARVPVRRDIALGAAEDHQHLGAVCALLPHRVGAGHMSGERAQRAAGRIEFEGQMVTVEALPGVRHQNAQGMAVEDVVQVVRLNDGEMGGEVHGGEMGRWRVERLSRKCDASETLAQDESCRYRTECS